MLGLSNLRNGKTQENEKDRSEALAIEYPDPGSPDILPVYRQLDDSELSPDEHSSHLDSLSLDGHSVADFDNSSMDQHSISPADETRYNEHSGLYNKPSVKDKLTVCYPAYRPERDEPTRTTATTVCYPAYKPKRDEPTMTSTTTVCYGDLGSTGKTWKPYLGGAHSSHPGRSTGPGMHGGQPKLLEWPETSTHTNGGSIHLGTYVHTARGRIASSLPGGLPGSITTLAEVQKRMDSLRLRMMPHRGSPLDRILHRAEGLAESVDVFLKVVQAADPAAIECSNLVMTCFKYLIHLISKGATTALEKAFTVFDQVAVVLDHLCQHSGLSSVVLSELLIKALVVVVDLDIEILQVLKSSSGDSTSHWSISFGSRFESYIKRLLQIEEEFSLEVWRLTVEGSSSWSQGINIETIRRWLSSETIIETITKFHGFSTITAPDTALPFKWLSDLTTKFWQSNNSMLFITGEAGCGKSGLVGSILDRSKARYSRGTKVLYFSVEPSLPGRRSSNNLVKSLLLQLFERTVGNAEFFKSLCNAYVKIEKNGCPDGESLLWSILKQQVLELSLKQSSSELLIVIDGLDKIKGGKVEAIRVRTLLHEVVSQHFSFRCIILSRPIFDDDYGPGCTGYTCGHGTLRDDIRHYVRIAIQTSVHLTFLTKQEMTIVIERALQCSLESFVAANLLVALIELQHTYQKILVALQSIPNTLLGMIDFLIMQVNFDEPQVKNIMSWLLVSQRVMTLKEIEIMTDPGFVTGSLGHNASQFFRASCASLIEIREGTVQFTHPCVKDHLLKLGRESTISLGPTSAHRVALRRCLEYIKHELHDLGDGMPTMEESGRLLDSHMRGRIVNDRLLEYCVLHYLSHYQESHLDGFTTDYKKVYLDSPQLAQCEGHYWQLHYSGLLLEQRHHQALQFRKSVFGNRSRSVVQNLITLSMLHISSGHSAKALPHLGEAWNLAVKLFGKNASICRQLALQYSEIFSTHSDFDLGFDRLAEELFEFLWVVEQERYGAMNDRVTVHVKILIDLYKRKNKYDHVARLLRQLYRECVVAFGRFDIRTIGYAEELIDVLVILGRHDEIGSLCEELFTGAGGSLDVWDHRRLIVLFRLIDWYVSQERYANAEEQLRSSWQILYDLVIAKQSLEARLALIQVTVRFGTLLIERNQREHAIKIVTKLWTALKEVKSSFNETILQELLTLSEYYVEVGIYEAVIPILLRLRTIYNDRMSMSGYIEAVRVNIALSKCYRHHPSHGDETSFLQDLLDSILAMNIFDEHCVDVAAELVNIYILQSNWRGATVICHSILERIWRDLIHFEGCDPRIPEKERQSAIRMALIFAGVLVKQESVSEAAGILGFIFNSFRSSLSLDDAYLFEAAQLYCDVLQKAGRIHDAIRIWRELRSAYVECFGARNDQYFRITEILVALYKITESSDGSEDVLIDIINGFGHGGGLCEPSGFDAVLVLIALYETQGRLDEVRTWFQRLWGSITVHHRSGHITEAQIYSAFTKYIHFLTSLGHRTEAIKIARELRTLLRCDFSISIFAIRADFELATLLGADSGRYHEAVTMYEEICQIHIEEFEQHDEILIIIQAATEQLSILYSRHSDLAKKAEEMLLKAWETAKRVKGCSHAHTYACFLKLIHYYKKKDGRAKDASERIAEYIVQILIEERAEDRLFELAESFFDLYQDLRQAKAGAKLLRDLRSDLSCLGNLCKHKTTRIGKSKIMLIDRRCFILINTLEELLSGRSRPTLFRDITQALLTESALYEAWSNVNRVSCSLQTQLAASSRLLLFLQNQKREIEYNALHQETWVVFQSHTTQSLRQSGPVWAFFEQCLEQMGKRQQSVVFVRALTKACVELHHTECFTGCLTLIEWASEYFLQDNWGSSTKEMTRIVFELARQIRVKTFTTSGNDSVVLVKIQQIISEIMIASFNSGGTGQVDICGLLPGEVNILIKFLTEKNDLRTLEQIFQSLWDSRVGHDRWQPTTTVSIGLRLCEVKFARGHRAEANELIEDMLYNLRDVHGPLHPLTIQCENLRARFLNRQGKHSGALDVHRNLLEEALRCQGHDHGHDYESGSGSYDIRNIMLEQTRYLKAAYELNGGWDEHGADRYIPVLNRVFGFGSGSRDHWRQIGKPSSWNPVCKFKKTDLGDLDVESAEDVLDAESSGFWMPPTEWTIPEGEEESEILDDFSGADDSWHDEEKTLEWACEFQKDFDLPSKELVLTSKPSIDW